MTPTGRRLALLVLMVVGLLTACNGASTRKDDVLTPIIPATTVVVDAATRGALAEYDPGTGVMRFATRTPTLARLRPDDVLASEPSPAAPYGFLRKVKAIREEGGGLVLETTQASLTEAIYQAELESSGTLEPSDLAGAKALVDGLTLRAAADFGDGYKFMAQFDEVLLDFDEGDVKVKVRVNGTFYFNAGYNISIKIRPCLDLPPACVEKFEAWAGVEQRAELRLSGEANARLTKEKKVAEYYFEPICFSLGVPVCFVPRVAVYVGATGEVNLRFDYRAVQTAAAKIGATWTSDGGWRNIDPTPMFDSSFTQQFDVSGSLTAKAYTKTEMALLLYGVAGMALGAKAELELDAAVPRDPLWILRGTLEAYYSFMVDLPVVGKVTESTGTLYRMTKEFGRSENSAPIVRIKRPRVEVDLKVPFTLAFMTATGDCSEYAGPFCVYDYEDGRVAYTLTSDRDGLLPTDKHTFTTPGLRTITVRATDSKGAVGTGAFEVDVINTPPVAYGDVRPYFVPATVPLFIGANASDPNGQLDCNALSWTVSAPDSIVPYAPAPHVCWGRAVFPNPGTRYVTLLATDPEGARSQPLTFTVNVSARPPDLPPAVEVPLSVNGRYYINGTSDGATAAGQIPFGYYLATGSPNPITLAVRATDPEHPDDPNAVTYTFSAFCSNCEKPGRVTLGSNTTGSLVLESGLAWYPHLGDFSNTYFNFELTFEVTMSDGVNTSGPLRWMVRRFYDSLW